MAEHRAEDPARRPGPGRRGERANPNPGPAPVPGPLPVQVQTTALPTGRKPTPPMPWTRKVTKAFRSKQGRWALMALASAAVIVIGLLGAGFLSSPAPALKTPPLAGDAGASTAPTSVSPSATPKTKGKNSLNGDPVRTLRNRFPDNPLNHLRGPGLHHVTVSAHAAGRMTVVGYLVPTGLGATYGSVKDRSSWTLTQQAIGPGYLAAIFVQTGKTGVPITCQIVIDGKVTSTETTSGAYGRALCLG
jgi:hypothetical protein